MATLTIFMYFFDMLISHFIYDMVFFTMFTYMKYFSESGWDIAFMARVTVIRLRFADRIATQNTLNLLFSKLEKQ